jgi:mono/diheme cytochrome c family protein
MHGAPVNHKLTAVLTTLGLLFPSAAILGADNAVPDLKDPAVIAAGHALFREKHCSVCHGINGEGSINLTRRQLDDPAYVFAAICDGREKNGMRMPSWRGVLTDEQIWQATAYVLSIASPRR